MAYIRKYPHPPSPHQFLPIGLGHFAQFWTISRKRRTRKSYKAITDEEDLFWSKGLLGIELILNTVYFYNGKLFGFFWGTQEEYYCKKY